MPATLTTWIAVPLLGATIGYVTNRIAVKMIFRPIRPVRILGIRVQGLLPRRQQDLAEKIGRVVGDHLVEHDDIVATFERIDFARLLESVLDEALASRIDELRNLPLIGGFLTEERVGTMRDGIVREVLRHRERILAELEKAVEEGLDVRLLVTEKVAAFPVEKLESLVLEVARRELRAIEVLGGVLGLMIGFGQVGLIFLMG